MSDFESKHMLKYIQHCIFNNLGNHCSIEEFDKNNEYFGCSFIVNNLNVKYRQGKITPTKKGVFVTLWKKHKNEPIQPFSDNDNIDLVIIGVKDSNKIGVFLFPKKVLIEQGIFSKKSKGGKRGFRLYPSWENQLNVQALKSQKWQIHYFFNLSTIGVDINKVKSILDVSIRDNSNRE